jgi:error-prone DNA polymerase
LLTRAHATHEKGTAGLTIEQVCAESRGLFAIVPVSHPDIARDALLGPVSAAFGERARLATWRHLDPSDGPRHAAVQAASMRFGVDVIASSRPLYHVPARKPLADVVHCIRHKTTLDAAGTGLSPNAEAFLRSEERMLSLYRDMPAWVHATGDLASEARFSLEDIHYHFPSEAMCLPDESPDEALRRLVEVGCKLRYPQGTPKNVLAQLEKELALIAKLDVAAYFLSVHQVVNIARGRRILCQGRGSAANSAVCFVLGVTAVDPARSSLLFERFLSAERAEPPDIDVDFEHERREEVIQDIYEIYGRDRAAMVSEVISYRGRSALREVGKAFGLSLDQVDRLSGLVMHMDDGITEARVAEAGLDPRDARIQQVFRLADALEGFPRHLSIHVGGFVLSAEPLDRVAPVEPARMPNRTVIPWDKDDIDALGFFKVDVLGLGMLTAIRKCLAMIAEADAPFDPIEALASIPPEAPEVYEAIQRADTIGVFQIESRAQMTMLPRLKPARFYDLVIEVAIVRPGPIQGGMVHPYLRRRTGEEAVTAPHPCLESILARTLGVPLFQEQVMQIAMTGAGYSAGEADQLRRDMAAWKKNGRLARHRERLLQGFAERGISEAFGEQLYKQIHGFAEYGFPESHAASFALLVYASSWLKVHHPAAFAAALLNSQPMGFYSPSSILQDAQRHGVEVRPVSIVDSDWDLTLEAPRESPSIRVGMRLVKGVGEVSGRAVMAARAEKPFADVEDLVHRARLKKLEVEALAEAGALDPIVPGGRRQALWRARGPREEGLFDGATIDPRVVELPPMQPVEQLVLDYGRLGFSVDDHPMRHVRPRLAKTVRSAKSLSRLRDGARVVVAGLVIGRQRPGTASGITFITLEDETGMMNLVVRKDTFAENYAVARHATLMLARGKLEREGDVIHILVRTMERLDLAGTDLLARSRDFH